MAKRRIINDGGGEFGPRTPTETRANKEVSPVTEVKIPRAQAFWVALPLAVAVVVSLVAPIALGQRIFWAVCGVCALAAFLWSVQFELDALDRVTLPILVGAVAWCFWRFADFAGWRVPESWQPWAALWAVFALVFWWTFVLALWLTFVQRLGMPMFHQQYSIWSALGKILEWFYTKREPTTPDDEPPARQVSFEVITEGGRIRHHVQPPVDDDTFTAVCDVLLSGKTYAEVNLCGTDKPLPGGENGRAILAELRAWMIDQGILRWNKTNGNGDAVTRQGVSVTPKGAQWLQEALPPHPTETERSGDENGR